MSDTKYAYAVARIRALENGLFSSAQIEQLLSVKSYEGANTAGGMQIHRSARRRS